jgi:putative flippase GtrA
MENKNEKKISIFKDKKVQKQLILYLVFAGCMIILNLSIQSLNEIIAPLICESFGHVQFIYVLYCSNAPFDMSNLVGQFLAVGVTVIVKFLLDKFIVFRTIKKIKETSREFFIYTFFSILATVWNISIQFILYQIIGIPWLISAIIALSTGYLLRFFLDRKYTFKKFKILEE